jgi:two-component system phosphate regulon response regulator PhoB
MAESTVLVVENEAPVRAFLEQQLTDDGFDVLSAARAGEALELVETASPALVLLDAVLPDGSGFELCSRLREGAPGRGWDRDVPVIIVSSRADPVDRVRGFARGCDDYVVNPLASLFSLAASAIRVGATAAGSPDGWCTAST